jgi:plasmid stabilization system protein ParE
MLPVIWPERLLSVLSDLHSRQQELIREKEPLLAQFPNMYPVRRTGPFAGCRCFVAHHWTIYYQVRREAVYIRALRPARKPFERE